MIKALHSHMPMTLFALSALIFVLLILQTSHSQNFTTNFNDTLLRTPTVVKGNYELTQVGFNMTFPKGWSGLTYGYIAMVSPDGINQLNGNLKRNEEKVLMVVEVVNASEYQKNTYKSQVQKDCHILSEKVSNINTAQSKEVYINCGSGGDQKIINYIFSSAKKMIIIGLKGTGDSFENNLDIFRNSVKTVTIKDPIKAVQGPS